VNGVTFKDTPVVSPLDIVKFLRVLGIGLTVELKERQALVGAS
jgi:hypothetical protein